MGIPLSLTKQENNFSKKAEQIFNKFDETQLNPVVRAHNIWRIVSDQVEDILGKEIHEQWFKKIVPLVISDKCLILLASSEFSCAWINKNYKELIDLLIAFQDKTLSSFIINNSDIA